MAKQKENAVVASQEQLADGIYSMWIQTQAAARQASGGSSFPCIRQMEASYCHARSAFVRSTVRGECFGWFIV